VAIAQNRGWPIGKRRLRLKLHGDQLIDRQNVRTVRAFIMQYAGSLATFANEASRIRANAGRQSTLLGFLHGSPSVHERLAMGISAMRPAEQARKMESRLREIDALLGPVRPDQWPEGLCQGFAWPVTISDDLRGIELVAGFSSPRK
jgi:hypothetical protein